MLIHVDGEMANEVEFEDFEEKKRNREILQEKKNKIKRNELKEMKT